jgi:hypothetical protein
MNENETPLSLSTASYTDALDHPVDSSVRSDHAIDYDSFDESGRSGHRSDYGDCSSIAPDKSYDTYESDVEQTSSHYESAHSREDRSHNHDDYDEDDEEDFPPGHITTLSQMEELQTRRKSTSSLNSSTEMDQLNPSILPTYFFCPLTRQIMKDPVLTPEGNTYERLALLRYLILDPCDPLTGNPLNMEHVRNDDMVRNKIEKWRREAWTRYYLEVGKLERCDTAANVDDDDASSDEEEDSDDDTTNIDTDDGEIEEIETEDEHDESEEDAIDESNYSQESEHLILVNTSSSEEPHPPSHHRTNQNANLLTSNFEGVLPANTKRSDVSIASSQQPTSTNIHGWNTPLGVHRIICKSPGLAVTADIHRRSAVIKRKVIKKSIKSKKKEHVSTETSRGRNVLSQISKKKKTTLTVSSKELILPPGSHVEIVETVVHGGRVRGNIVWEEEMIVEYDEELLSQLRSALDEQEDHPSMGASSNNNKKKKSFFRRKNSNQGNKNPFSSDLFAESPLETTAVRERSPSPPPLTTVKYSGWISLEWAGNNREREEARLRNDGRTVDEDDGPWSHPLPLGVYRIQGARRNGRASSSSQLSLSEAADNDRNITHILADGQCVEIVETQVVVMKTKLTHERLLRKQTGMNAADGICGIRTVRARCMVPILIPPMIPEHVDGMRCVNARPQKKFKSGWISLCDDNVSRGGANAVPLLLGAYIVVSNGGCTVTEGHRTDSKVKSILPCRSCVEVVTTRMEFEENEELMTCHCGRESLHSVVAVRALIATGGHLTLFVFPISTSGSIDNVCYCGKFVQHTNAEPVPLGLYKITHPDGVSVTTTINKESPIISSIAEGVQVQVLQTGVEDGCVRGRISVQNDPAKEPVVGWVNLFEFPDLRWAEYEYVGVL